ncbi:prepilin-type N-terminal cleavage/methylation domain-containing protein [Clostridium perfringens]|uniref:prepilin-type N-terminal cleavage/methylation domain-containing protein n=1 Tax=Clostridium perfringens TaxID=1502 RepID=UPI001CCC4706|nr:prepilin-type N-terminal cleavage/methylation domain-containing protein [Clostridium perfringens]MDH5097430.1 putative major pilin subunit [Clostridium perfringens]MDK0751064.1 prepilin-type N-terminal cleavage/methylation domain-containing protein [Clostridium perfringens]MDM0783969.1 prepilin-type N-terminal cleavage/methylation domain-containing protein [Clostridium perfringens]MDM0865475.1 prepilin-type N-terminal cleavage/methylation domain-containing protein [Clostridium perfringens]M
MTLIKSRQSNLSNKKKKGFTLIELIVVIAIIAILAAIAIPNFLSIQRKSRVKADVATAKTIYDATSALIAEGKIVPGSDNVKSPVSLQNAGTDNTPAGEIEKYLSGNNEFNIPKMQSISGGYYQVAIGGSEENPSISVYSINGNKRVDFYPNYSESEINNAGGKATEKPDNKTVTQ